MQDNKCGEKLAQALKGKQIDILINNAGYFYEPVEKIDSLNFEEVRFCPQRVSFIFYFIFYLCVYLMLCCIMYYVLSCTVNDILTPHQYHIIVFATDNQHL